MIGHLLGLGSILMTIGPWLVLFGLCLAQFGWDRR